MKKLFKHMTIYGLGGILTKLINFLLLPVYTRLLAPSVYGTLELVYLTGNILGILYGFMIGSGYLRNYYDNDDLNYRNKLLGSAFWFTFFNSLIFSILFVLFSKRISFLIFGFKEGNIYINLIAITTLISAHSILFYNYLMVREKSRLYITIQVTSLVLTLILTIYFIVVAHLSVKGILFAQLIGKSAEFLILAIILLKSTIFSISKTYIYDMLKYSIPLIPIQIAFFILNLSDRFFLKHYQSLDDVGLYSLGYKFASLLPLFTIQPLRAYGPYIFSLVATPEICKKNMANFTRYYIAGVLLITLIISMFSSEIIFLMAQKSYHEGWRVVYLLCLSFVFYGIVNVIALGIEIIKKNWISSIIWLFAAIISLLSNFILIPRYGIIGASITSTISYFFVLICYFIILYFLYPIPFEYLKFFILLVFSSFIYIFPLFIKFNLLVLISIKTCLIFIFIIFILKSGYLYDNEIVRGKIIFSSIFHKFKKTVL